MERVKYIGDIIVPGGILKDGCILTEDGQIVAVSPADIPCEARVVDARGSYIAPGFVEIHCHGGGGHDFMDATPEAFEGAARLHMAHGVTTLFPTTVASSTQAILKCAGAYKQSLPRTQGFIHMPGLHIEGPYVSMEERGALDPRYIGPPDPDQYRRILDEAGCIRRWTVAPELPGALDMGDELCRRGVVVSFGHTSCTTDEAVRARNHGFTHVTHLYSGMPQGVRRRNAYRIGGLIEAAYLYDDITVELIADGCHLPAELLRLAIKIKGIHSTALITDAMRGAGQPEGPTILGGLDDGQPAIIEDGVAKLPDRSCFAGSVATADRLLRTVTDLAGVSIPDAVMMLTGTPAAILGIADRAGSLAPGYPADLVLLHQDLTVRATVVSGRLVYGQVQ